MQATARWDVQCSGRELLQCCLLSNDADVSGNRLCQPPTKPLGYLQRELIDQASRPCVPPSQPCTRLYIWCCAMMCARRGKQCKDLCCPLQSTWRWPASCAMPWSCHTADLLQAKLVCHSLAAARLPVPSGGSGRPVPGPDVLQVALAVTEQLLVAGRKLPAQSGSTAHCVGFG